MKVALQPQHVDAYAAAVERAGGQISPLGAEVRGLIWTDYQQPALLMEILSQNPQIEWVQLPFAGVDAFSEVLTLPIRFTSAKGAYRQPVAEHALALCLALGRAIPTRVRAKAWGEKFAKSLYESNVLVVGGGGITEELVKVLHPFGCSVTVVRKHPAMLLGNRTVGFEHLDSELATPDYVVIAAALTDETVGLFDYRRLSLMKSSAYLVNVARGKHIVTNDLVDALANQLIAGAAVDVTDPEPLPVGHALWSEERCLITPHTADTPEQVIEMLANRIFENVLAFQSKREWVGLVDPSLGY